VGCKKYIYSYRPTGVGPDRPGDSFHTIVLPARAEGGLLFDRPKRGRKKPHQPALAHVHSRRRAGPRCGGRLGSASGQRIGRARRVILRSRFAQTSIRRALRCAARPPLAPHRESPGGGGRSSDETANPRRVLFGSRYERVGVLRSRHRGTGSVTVFRGRLASEAGHNR